MYGKTRLLDDVSLSDGSHELCNFECLNCFAKYKKEYRNRNTPHRCPSYRQQHGVDQKWCFKCKSWLDLEYFQKAKHVYGGYSKTCRNCRQTYMKKAETRRQVSSRSFYEETGLLPSLKLRSLVSGAKTRAYKYDLPFDIDNLYIQELWIKQDGKCYYSNQPIKWSKDKVSFWSPSIDRLYPEKGYVKGNVVLTLFAINSFKQDLNVDEFLQFLKSTKWLD